MQNNEEENQEQEAANYLKIVLELNEILANRVQDLEREHNILKRTHKQLEISFPPNSVAKSPVFSFNIN